MGRAYSQDLRERVMAAVESGTGAYVVASVFQGSVSYIYKALGRRRTTEESSARRRLTGSISWKGRVYP
ncbi:MAG TPA: IS630 transposase-related protein [Methylocella sp.]|nr:IS630 transposase-related protein [Methylocella sp.]